MPAPRTLSVVCGGDSATGNTGKAITSEISTCIKPSEFTLSRLAASGGLTHSWHRMLKGALRVPSLVSQPLVQGLQSRWPDCPGLMASEGLTVAAGLT